MIKAEETIIVQQNAFGAQLGRMFERIDAAGCGRQGMTWVRETGLPCLRREFSGNSLLTLGEKNMRIFSSTPHRDIPGLPSAEDVVIAVSAAAVSRDDQDRIYEGP